MEQALKESSSIIQNLQVSTRTKAMSSTQACWLQLQWSMSRRRLRGLTVRAAICRTLVVEQVRKNNSLQWGWVKAHQVFSRSLWMWIWKITGLWWPSQYLEIPSIGLAWKITLAYTRCKTITWHCSAIRKLFTVVKQVYKEFPTSSRTHWNLLW